MSVVAPGYLAPSVESQIERREKSGERQVCGTSAICGIGLLGRE